MRSDRQSWKHPPRNPVWWQCRRLFFVALFCSLQGAALAADRACDPTGRCLSTQDSVSYWQAEAQLKIGNWVAAAEMLAELYEAELRAEEPANFLIANNYAVALAGIGRPAAAALVLEKYFRDLAPVGRGFENLMQTYEFLAPGDTASKPLNLEMIPAVAQSLPVPQPDASVSQGPALKPADDMVFPGNSGDQQQRAEPGSPGVLPASSAAPIVEVDRDQSAEGALQLSRSDIAPSRATYLAQLASGDSELVEPDIAERVLNLPVQSVRLLEEADIAGRSSSEIRTMRNEIYARHGFIFQTGGEMDTYFRSQPWYEPRFNDVGHLLSPIEGENIWFLRRNE